MLSGEMGRLKNLAQMVRDFAANHVEEPDVSAAPDGADGYTNSTKISLFLLKKDLSEPLRKFGHCLNEMPGILDMFGLEASPDFSSFSVWDGEIPVQDAPPAPFVRTYPGEVSSWFILSYDVNLTFENREGLVKLNRLITDSVDRE